MRPTSPEELATLVRERDRIDVPLLGGEGLSFAGLTGEIRHDVADGVVSCPAGTPLSALNDVLAQDERCIPHLTVWPSEIDDLASLILLGLPHGLEGTFGSWRDWILGATMVTAEGTIVKSGSRVVKSVAGYDAHKLLIGSRGTLLLPVEVVLRTFHLFPAGFPQGVYSLGDNVRSIQRVRLTDLAECVAILGTSALRVDETNGTVWSSRSVQDLPSFPDGWSIDPRRPAIPESLLAIHRKAKAILDPRGKLAPGAFHNL